jgi:TRAP-type C4-dicarboxylate transport system substrate-binding protein
MEKCRKLTPLFLVAMLALFVIAPGIQAAEIKIALDCPPDLEKCGTYVWSHAFAEHLKANGLEVKEYATEALGGEDEKLDQVSQGLLEVSNSLLTKVGQINPSINGFWLFFLWDSYAHLDRVIQKSDLMAWINSTITPKGVRLLAPIPVGGFSGIANTKHPILVPDDLKGLRMRATDKLQAEYLKAWGASTVVIPWPEIYNALQTGVADGYLNPAIVPTLFKHTEVIKYYSDMAIGAPLRVAIASEAWYSGLSEKDRKIVDDAVVAANAANRKWLSEVVTKSIAALKEAGVQVSTPSAAQQAQFATLARSVYTQVVPEDVLKRYLAAAEKYR